MSMQPQKRVALRVALAGILAATVPVAMATAHPQDPYGILRKPIPDKTVVFTFDDGCKSHSAFVGPLLKEHGFGATFYITEAYGFESRKDWYMTWGEISGLEKTGFEIGNHTVNHWGLSAHSVDACIKTTVGIERRFKEMGISRPTTFCWPFYHVNNEFCSWLGGNGYLFARGGGERVYDPASDSPFDVPSFTIHDKALEKDPMAFVGVAKRARDGMVPVFCFHGVPDGEHPQVGLEPGKFRGMVAYLKNEDYNVIALRDLGRYVDTGKAALYLHRPVRVPWGREVLDWGWCSQEGNRLYVGIDKLPEDRKLTLSGLTTKVARAWFLGDENTPVPVTTSDMGVATLTVPGKLPLDYGTSPVLLVAELRGGPVATVLDFAFPGLPEVTIRGNEIRGTAPESADLGQLIPVYDTGSTKVTGTPASGRPHDFSKPEELVVSAPGGATRSYTVTIDRKAGVAGVANPGFESFESLDGKDGTFGMDPEATCWTFTQKGDKRGKWGILSLGSPHLQAIPPPDGSAHCAVLQGAANSISQVAFFDEGEYVITFDHNVPHRAFYEFPSLKLMLDDRVLTTVAPVSLQKGSAARVWTRHASPAVAVSGGLHTIRFVVGDEEIKDLYGIRGSNLIDNVRIEKH